MYREFEQQNPVLPEQSNVPLCDRVAHMEGMVLSFVAEHNLSFAMANNVIELATEMMRDPLTVKKLKLSRTVASYKLTDGLSKGLEEELIEKLKKCFFSLNLDEATSLTHHKVLTLLVSYFSDVKKEIVVEHLTSLNLPTVNSLKVYDAVETFFRTNKLPWPHLLSTLMDSCGVMRGVKNGFETKLRDQVAPNLLDIDGDACHHIHNAAKKFTKVFDKYLETLYRDIYNDFKWSEDLRVVLEDLCQHLGITYRQPEMYAATRWLSIYEITISHIYRFDALVVLYFSFLSDGDKILYKSRLDTIYSRRKATEESKKAIKKHQSFLKNKKKNLTKDGKARKGRICGKLFHTKTKTKLQMSLYSTALMAMKKFVKVFQQEEPAVYRIHTEQLNVFMEFLIDFVKPEVIAQNKDVNKLKKVDFHDKKNQLPKTMISVGTIANKLLKKVNKDHPTVQEFLSNALKAYAVCAKYMAEKLPLENEFLKNIAAIDPVAITSRKSIVLQSLLKLPCLMKNVLVDEEVEMYDNDCRRVFVDFDLPDVLRENKPVRADSWWWKLNEKYPALSKLSLAALTVFHGPRVESSFSVMGEVMDKKSGRMNVSTYSAIQTVKYSLAAKASKVSKKQKCVQIFHREDKLKSLVLKNVVTKIRNSKKTYVERIKNLGSSSSTSSSTTVTKKAVLKTAADVETALKKKLVSERSKGNKENEPVPEKSSTTVSSSQQSKKRHAIPEDTIPTKKIKTVQSSLNSYFQRKSV